ncbi:MAG: sporulation peptidase YabG [Bacilli bacterium]
MSIFVGQYVTRKSYQGDVVFRIKELRIPEQQALLYGASVRLEADAPLSDLTILERREWLFRQAAEEEQLERSVALFQDETQTSLEATEYRVSNGYQSNVQFFQMPGKVLHIDGDANYLKRCLELYERLGVPAHGVYCKETEMYASIVEWITQYAPDIVVLTGHDAFQKGKGPVDDLESYRHSKHFVAAVKAARQKVPSLDQLIIFAGACQSNFEAIITAGANFASSPGRINIHALDPVYVVAKVSFTSFMDKVNVWELIRNTFTGERGLGGIDTKGLLRTGLPLGMYSETENESNDDLF